MADGEHQIGAVHRVKMEILDAVLGELLHLSGDHRGGDQLARLGIVIEAVELLFQPWLIPGNSVAVSAGRTLDYPAWSLIRNGLLRT